MSSSSDSSGPSSCESILDPVSVAQRVLRRLQRAPLDQSMAVADHQKATDAMMRLKDAMMQGDPGGRGVATRLTCAGIAVHRRVLIGPEQLDAAESLRTTMALLFVLVVLATGGNEPEPTGHEMDCDDGGGTIAPERVNAEERRGNVTAWQMSSLWEAMRLADDDTATSSWANALREPGGLCQTLLQLVRNQRDESTLAELADYGQLFFRASAAAMASSLLDSAAPILDGNDFLTLGVVHLVGEGAGLRDERLQGIADCAESESGQTVRDFISAHEH